MRTFTISILGAIAVFAFFWYNGQVGTVELGPVRLEPPAERPLMDRLRQLQEEARAIGGEFAPAEAAAVTLSEDPRFYAGQLIAKPRRAMQAPGLGGVQAFAASSGGGPAVDALVTASSVGDVETGGGETLIINLDFDLEAAAAPAPVQPEGLVQPLSFNQDWRARADAARERARDLVYRGEDCVEDGDAATDPANRIACAIEDLEESGRFEYVEQNFIVSHQMESGGQPLVAAPTDPLYALQWHYRTQGDGAEASPGGAGFADFWTRQRQLGSPDVVVAVIDTGLDLSHPEIRASRNVVEGVDMVSQPFYANDGDGRDLDPTDPGDKCDPNDPFAEDSFHGTHVAGTIGAVATDDGQGVAGGAWSVTLVPVRALGRCGGLQSDINDAIRWAAGVEPTIVEDQDGGTILYNNPNPADVINLSLGFPAPNGCPRSTQDAIDDAVAAGAIVVAAAGNASVNVEGYGPAGCDNVLTVAAGDAAGALAHYSNWGDGVDIMAPGGDMRADLNNDGQPDGVLSTKRRRNCADPVTGERVGECIYAWENGTSMAAPHVSAAVALLMSEYPDRADGQIVSILTERARSPRAMGQCTLPCGVGGGVPVDGQDGMCFRPCGSGLMDLGKAVEDR